MPILAGGSYVQRVPAGQVKLIHVDGRSSDDIID